MKKASPKVINSNNHIVLALDLESMQPSKSIIQIGACIGDLRTGEILETFNRYIDPGEPISPFIEKLTGISDLTIQEQGISLRQGYEDLVKFADRPRFYSMVTWGGGDARCLKEQVTRAYDEIIIGKVFEWPFGHREMDIKTIFQFTQLARGAKPQSGLAKSLTKFGLKFIGRKHSAEDDAKNTFLLASHLFKSAQCFEFQKILARVK